MFQNIRSVIVLDYLAHGRDGDESPQYRRSKLIQAIVEDGFVLCELVLNRGPMGTIGDSIDITDYNEHIECIRQIEYEDLSVGAKSELDRTIRDIIENDNQKFVNFFNDSTPVSIRLHQLNLLPGVGGKLRDRILEYRKYSSFESFGDLEEKIEGLHKPQEIILNRILEEIKDPNMKYRLFVHSPK
tara:strand:- start:13137 stop:13694 length:558 start_codon:yes stop_codon:yes gene_type:complete